MRQELEGAVGVVPSLSARGRRETRPASRTRIHNEIPGC